MSSPAPIRASAPGAQGSGMTAPVPAPSREAVRGAGLPVVRTTVSAATWRPSASRTPSDSIAAASPTMRVMQPGCARSTAANRSWT